jgi:hypothetical protein
VARADANTSLIPGPATSPPRGAYWSGRVEFSLAGQFQPCVFLEAGEPPSHLDVSQLTWAYARRSALLRIQKDTSAIIHATTMPETVQ